MQQQAAQAAQAQQVAQSLALQQQAQAQQAQQQGQVMMALFLQQLQQQPQQQHQALPQQQAQQQQQAPLVVIHPWKSLHPSHLPDTPAGTHLVLASAQPWPGYWSVVYHGDAGPTSRLIGRQYAELGASCLLRPLCCCLSLIASLHLQRRRHRRCRTRSCRRRRRPPGWRSSRTKFGGLKDCQLG